MEDHQLKKGILVNVDRFCNVLYQTEANEFSRWAPKSSAQKKIFPLQNKQPGTKYLVVGYVIFTLGDWICEEEEFFLTNTQRVRLWKVTPYDSSLYQTFLVLPEDLHEAS